MTLNALLAGLRRRWLVVVVFVILGAAAAGAYALVTKPVYASDTQLFVALQTTPTNTPAELVAGNNFAAQKISSYVSVVTSQRVLDEVAAEIGGDPDQISSDVSASSEAESVIITIRAEAANPDDAALLANTVATVFADVVVNQIESPTGGGPGPIKVETLATAEADSNPVAPDVPLAVVLGLIAGLLIGGAVAIVLTLIDRRVRTEADVVTLAGRQPLGVLKGSNAGGRIRPSSADLHSLALTVGALANLDDFATVAVAAPAAAAAGTTAGLGQALAQSGLRTVVVDAVFAGDGVSSAFRVTDRPGLREVLAGTRPLSEVLLDTNVTGLQVLPLGQDSEVSVSALLGRGFADIVAQLGELSDFVLIDAGAVLGSGDALAGHVNADRTIVVVETGSLDKDEVTDALGKMETVGASVLGVVVLERTRRGAAGSKDSGQRLAPSVPA